MMHVFLVFCRDLVPHGLGNFLLQRALRRLLGKTRPGDPSLRPIYVIGPFRLDNGIGEGARLYYRARKAAGQDVVAVDCSFLYKKPDRHDPGFPILSVSEARRRRGPGRLSIHCNPPFFGLMLLLLGRKFCQDKYIVPYFAWELEVLPTYWKDSLAFAQAVEAPSAFSARPISQCTDRDVTVVPHEISLISQRSRCFAADGVLRVLFIFDIYSTVERKNPLCAIRAFHTAFGDRLDVHFTIKTSTSPQYRKELDQLKKIASRHRNVTVIYHKMTSSEIADLYMGSDIYLSLHRSEGFGLTIREAMQYGLHVIATGWSGNMDYLHGPKTYPVDFELVPVAASAPSYFRAPGARWAEANVAHAALLLQCIEKSEKTRAKPVSKASQDSGSNLILH